MNSDFIPSATGIASRNLATIYSNKAIRVRKHVTPPQPWP